MDTLADTTQIHKTRYVVNETFDRAILVFEDDSYLQFEHTSRKNRWVKASAEQSMADSICQSLHGFRLNAKHLQLYFDDGSDVEFRDSRQEAIASSDNNPQQNH